MKTTEQLFHESINHYRNLILKTSELYENMATLSPDVILKRCKEIQSLQKEQGEMDKFITDVMLDIGPQILEAPYVGEYQRILNETKKSTDKVASKARTIRALLRNEMKKVQHGQKSLAGYNTTVSKDNMNTLHGSY